MAENGSKNPGDAPKIASPVDVPDRLKAGAEEIVGYAPRTAEDEQKITYRWGRFFGWGAAQVPIGQNLVSFWEKPTVETADEAVNSMNRCQLVAGEAQQEEGRSMSFFRIDLPSRIAGAIDAFKRDAMGGPEGKAVTNEAKLKSIQFLEAGVKKAGWLDRIGGFITKVATAVGAVSGFIGVLSADPLFGKIIFGSWALICGFSFRYFWNFYRRRAWWRDAGTLTASMLRAQMAEEARLEKEKAEGGKGDDKSKEKEGGKDEQGQKKKQKSDQRPRKKKESKKSSSNRRPKKSKSGRSSTRRKRSSAPTPA